MSGYLGPFVSGGGGGAGGEEVFRWNGVDTSQFEGAAVYADGGAVGTLSVVTTAWGPRALRLTCSAGTTGNIGFYAVDPLPFVTDRRDVIMQLDVFNFVPGAGGYAGVFLGEGSGAGFHALNRYPSGTAAWGSRVTAATRLTSGTTDTAIGNSGFFTIYWWGQKRVGFAPEIESGAYSLASGGTGILSRLRRSGPAASTGGALDFGNDSAYAASWNALSLTRWGLTLQSSGGNPMPTNFDIMDLRIYLV